MTGMIQHHNEDRYRLLGNMAPTVFEGLLTWVLPGTRGGSSHKPQPAVSRFWVSTEVANRVNRRSPAVGTRARLPSDQVLGIVGIRI